MKNKFSTDFVNSIDKIGEREWDKLDIQTCYQSFGWVKNVEKLRGSDCHYIVIKNHNEISGIALCYLTTNPKTFHSYNLSDIVNNNEDNNLQLFPNLICVTREGYSAGILFKKELDSESVYKVTLELLKSYYLLGKSLSCRAIAFLYLDEGNPVRILLKDDFCEVLADCNSKLSVKWDTLEEYIESYKKKTRIRIEISSPERNGITFSVEKLDDLPLERLAYLQQNLDMKYGHKADISRLVKRLESNQQLPLDNVVYVARRKGEIVAFSLFYQQSNRLFNRVGGFDYENILKEDYLYFNILFYRPLIYAIENGFKEIDYGIGSSQTKKSRKCSLMQRYSYTQIID